MRINNFSWLSIFVCILILFSPAVFSQELKGKVVDEAGKPVSNAKISVARTSFTTTNRDGSFRIRTDSKLTQINPSDVRILQTPQLMIKRTNFNQRSNFLIVTMQPATELRGQLLVRDNASVAGGHMVVLLGVNDFSPVRTNEQGKFTIQYPSGFKLDKEAVFKVDDQIISPANVSIQNNGGSVKISYIKSNALTTAPLEKTPPKEELSQNNQKKDRILLINAQGQPIPNLQIKLNNKTQRSDARGYIFPAKLDFNRLPTIDVSPATLLQKLSDPPIKLLRLVINNQETPVDDTYSLEKGFDEITKGLKDDRQAQIDRSNRIQSQMSELTSRLLQESHFTPTQRNVLKDYLHTLRETLVDNDSIYNFIKEEFQNRLFKMENLVVEKDSLRYLAEARAEKISIEKQRVEDEKKLAEIKFRDNLIILSIIILVLLALASTFYFYNRDIKRKNNELEITKNELADRVEEINQQNEEIKVQRDNISDKNQQIEKAYGQIKSSILSAERIQNAILKPPTEVMSHFEDGFILYAPRDIVSGDFFWYAVRGNEVIVAAVDCTGHGVPGAFMTMLGHSFLNQIVNENFITEPAEILRELDKKVKSTLHQNERDLNSDGMDMSILNINRVEKRVIFAGAKNPLYYFVNGQFLSIKGSNKPIGGTSYRLKKDFESKELSIEGGEVFYMQSDGYQDQFGGQAAKRRKFMKKHYKQILSEIYYLPMSKQEEILQTKLNQWKGNHPQTDDILVMGIRV